jgi:hypothetical protein
MLCSGWSSVGLAMCPSSFRREHTDLSAVSARKMADDDRSLALFEAFGE